LQKKLLHPTTACLLLRVEPHWASVADDQTPVVTAYCLWVCSKTYSTGTQNITKHWKQIPNYFCLTT
jgi:hypothetical protein